MRGSTPWGFPLEITTLLNSPISSTNTVNSIMYPLVGLPDMDKKLKSGKHKGENKYWRNIRKYWIPYYKHIEQLYNMDEDESIFNVFDTYNMG